MAASHHLLPLLTSDAEAIEAGPSQVSGLGASGVQQSKWTELESRQPRLRQSRARAWWGYQRFGVGGRSHATGICRMRFCRWSLRRLGGRRFGRWAGRWRAVIARHGHLQCKVLQVVVTSVRRPKFWPLAGPQAGLPGLALAPEAIYTSSLYLLSKPGCRLKNYRDTSP